MAQRHLWMSFMLVVCRFSLSTPPLCAALAPPLDVAIALTVPFCDTMGYIINIFWNEVDSNV